MSKQEQPKAVIIAATIITLGLTVVVVLAIIAAVVTLLRWIF